MIGYANSIGNAALGTITQVSASAATKSLGSAAGGLASVATSVFSGGSTSLTSAAQSFASNLSSPAASVMGEIGVGGLPGTGEAAPASSDVTWTFICTPDEISWTSSNAVNRVEMFGTNNPPAISGTKGMREFSLNNALVEGFTRNKKVEAKIGALEDLLKFSSSLAGGYVNVPVYQVWANEKGYGQQAFFLMKSVQVKETIRDLAGDATRAYVDVSFIEVPAFQVDSGIDQAPFSQQGASSTLVKNTAAAQAQQAAAAKAPPAAAPKTAPR
jgi:hypothetical protein